MIDSTDEDMQNKSARFLIQLGHKYKDDYIRFR